MRRKFPVAPLVAVVVLVLSVLPSAIVVLSSFSSAKALTFPPSHISLAAYGSLFADGVSRVALFHSLIIGTISVVVAVPLGTAAALGLRAPFLRGRVFIMCMLLLGLASPLVVSGVAYLVIETNLQIIGSLLVLGLTIAVINLPFVFYLVSSALDRMNPELTEASFTLGAEELQTFLFVTLPEIMPGVLASALLLFIFGITDFTISIILATTSDATLPVVIFGSLRSGLTPRLAAAGGLYIGLAVVITVILSRTGIVDRFFFQED
jgi:putative spermidine/putrescine transport system permease protein